MAASRTVAGIIQSESGLSCARGKDVGKHTPAMTEEHNHSKEHVSQFKELLIAKTKTI